MPVGFELLINNFSLGIIGVLLTIFAMLVMGRLLLLLATALVQLSTGW